MLPLRLQATGTSGLTLALQRFVIEDRLVGGINPAMRFLARSFPAAEAPPPTPVPAARTPGLSLIHI